MLPEFLLPKLERDWGGLNPGFEVVVRNLKFFWFQLDYLVSKFTLFPPNFSFLGYSSVGFDFWDILLFKDLRVRAVASLSPFVTILYKSKTSV